MHVYDSGSLWSITYTTLQNSLLTFILSYTVIFYGVLYNDSWDFDLAFSLITTFTMHETVT